MVGPAERLIPDPAYHFARDHRLDHGILPAMNDRLWPGSNYKHRSVNVGHGTATPQHCEDVPTTLRTGEAPPSAAPSSGRRRSVNEVARNAARIDHAYMLTELVRLDDDACED